MWNGDTVIPLKENGTKDTLNQWNKRKKRY